MTTSSYSALCRSLDPRTPHPTVYQKMVSDDTVISLRPVQLNDDDDLQTISEWLHHGYAIQLPVDQLRVMYILIAESSYTQAFMVWLNHDSPIAQLDVYQVSQDELKGHYPAKEGDFRLHTFVIPAPELFDDLPVHIVKMALEYFFDFPEVKRVVWSVNTRDTRTNTVARKSNFKLLGVYVENTGDGDQEMNLYTIQG